MEIKIEKDPVHTGRVAVRLTKEEVEAMQKICKQQGITYSVFVRYCIDETIKKAMVPITNNQTK